jgi:hypothetical protein
VRTKADGTGNIVTDYFRTHFNFTGDPSTARMRIRHMIDDGAIVYLNGVEVHRFGFTPDAVVNSGTFSAGNEGKDRYAGPFDIPTTSLVQGDNVIAVEVHQSDVGSSDMVFGLELQQVTSAAPPTQPRFSRVARSGANIQVEWTGAGTLESTDRLGGTWTPLPAATSPHSEPIAGSAKFFRVRR